MGVRVRVRAGVRVRARVGVGVRESSHAPARARTHAHTRARTHTAGGGRSDFSLYQVDGRALLRSCRYERGARGVQSGWIPADELFGHWRKFGQLFFLVKLIPYPNPNRKTLTVTSKP